MLRGKQTDQKSRSISFDPQRRAGTDAMKAAVAALSAFLEQREAALRLRQRARTKATRTAFLLAVEAIACNLAGLLLINSQLPLAVPRSSGAMWAKGRYAFPVYGQHFLDALDLMAHPKVGLIVEVAKGYGSLSSKGQRTTIRPSLSFSDHVPSSTIGWESFCRADEPEVLVLKGRKDPQSGRAPQIDYPETALTRRMRKEVALINGNLAAGRFWIVSDGDCLGETKEGVPIDLTRQSVRRIFNNASWDEGGRLFDGFWETMRSEDRRLLLIATDAHPNGEPIVNVDYGQIFPRLAYFRTGKEPPEGDLYAFGEPGWSREGCKKVLNAMLLSNRPLRNWPEDTKDQFPKGTKFGDGASAVRAFHAPIAKLLDAGIGLRLMRYESDLLINALLRLGAMGVTALPLHDSVLVGKSDTAAAEAAMHSAFIELCPGARASVQVK